MLKAKHNWLKRYPSAKISAYIIDDFIKGLKLSVGKIGSGSGSAHFRTQSEAESKELTAT